MRRQVSGVQRARRRRLRFWNGHVLSGTTAQPWLRRAPARRSPPAAPPALPPAREPSHQRHRWSAVRIRTSTGAFLRRGHDDVVRSLEERLSAFAMVPAGAPHPPPRAARSPQAADDDPTEGAAAPPRKRCLSAPAPARPRGGGPGPEVRRGREVRSARPLRLPHHLPRSPSLLSLAPLPSWRGALLLRGSPALRQGKQQSPRLPRVLAPGGPSAAPGLFRAGRERHGVGGRRPHSHRVDVPVRTSCPPECRPALFAQPFLSCCTASHSRCQSAALATNRAAPPPAHCSEPGPDTDAGPTWRRAARPCSPRWMAQLAPSPVRARHRHSPPPPPARLVTK